MNTNEQITKSQLDLQRQRQIGHQNGLLEQIKRNTRKGWRKRTAKKRARK